MLDYHLAAADGPEGRVQDFLFDDESWIVHYLVAETATPIGIRNVLILPFAAIFYDPPIDMECHERCL